jgi:hypothetical protein
MDWIEFTHPPAHIIKEVEEISVPI